VMMFVGGVVSVLDGIPAYSYRTKPTVQEFFVPTRTQIVVILLS